MTMKRPHDGHGPQQIKRQKDHHNGSSKPAHLSPANGQQTQQEDVQKPRADPLSTLSSLLRSMASNPATTATLLGPSAVEQAQGLLASLGGLEKSNTTALDIFQPATTHSSPPIPAYYAGADRRLPESSPDLPPLPLVPDGPYSSAPFTHKSVSGTDRVVATQTLDYERLEFLGDAYIETIATRLIFARYPHFATGRQAQIRERLVKNETLCGFSRAYSFDKRLAVTDNERRCAEGAAGNKGLNKILADVFEAYVAAVILSDPETGFARAESWLTELWAPILLLHYGPESERALAAEYNPHAKAELQTRVGVGAFKDENTVIDYVQQKPMAQSKHTQTFFIGAHLTGWGFEKEFLGEGTGQNKAEAGTRAAMDALVRSRAILDKAEELYLAKKAARDADRDDESRQRKEKRTAERAAKRELRDTTLVTETTRE